ncbi:MAG: VCBS repeat-containing protein [Bacteroidota bacterium]
MLQSLWLKISLYILPWLMIGGCSSDEARLKSTDSEEIQLLQPLPPDQSGIEFENTIVENSRINILNYLYYYNGSGVAIGDINNDGLPDIYFAATVGENKLFLNQGNLKFQDITASAEVKGDFGITTGVSLVDINNDGYLDIYVCKSGDQSERYRTNQLFVNQGNLTFSEQAAEFGLDDASFSNQAYFFDMDEDGDLDMYLVNHPVDWANINKIMTGEQEKDGFYYEYSDKLYRNNGRDPESSPGFEKFEDITREAGVLNRSWGLSAAVGDFNGDHRPDIYVANDFLKPDNMYVNQGNNQKGRLTFNDQLPQHFRHNSFYSMGSDYADINNDGLNDLYVVDMAMKGHIRSKRNMGSMSTENFTKIIERGYHYPYSTNTLHLNLGNQHFTEIAQMAGVDKTDWSWAPLLVDLDNDGYKDIFVTNGIYRDIIDNDFLAKRAAYDEDSLNSADNLLAEIPQTKIKNMVFRNQGDLTFKDMSQSWGISEATNSNGAAYADLDNDGDLDIVINNLNEPSFIYKNLSADSLANNFIKVKLTGSATNSYAIGATVAIRYSDQQQRLDMMPTRGYLSSVDYTLHFGLGNSQNIDSLIVTWPDEQNTIVKNPTVNQVVNIDYSSADFSVVKASSPPEPILIDVTDLTNLNHKHMETAYDDFQKELLLPHKLSENGPFVSVADVNNDGLEDFFIGGSAGEAASLYLQTQKGKFMSHSASTWESDRKYEDQKSTFFDADEDGDLDLYVVSGSNEFTDEIMYQDRLYLNDGDGNFQRAIQALPTITASGSDVDHGDFDGDGDLDLIVGGRVVPGKYPTASRSYLLQNQNGKFEDVTEELASELMNIGMVTDLEFSDIDGDEDLDIVALGEWMPITVFRNQAGQFERVTPENGLSKTHGWWFSLNSGDIDNDGDIDYIAGNIGQNNKYHPTSERPLHIYYNDFDQNGTGDIVLSKRENATLYPVRGRECSSQQMPFIAENFPDYKSFAQASLQEIYSENQIEDALHYEAYEFRSAVLMNDGKGNFTISYLPPMAQISPLMGGELLDLNGDSKLDIVAVGNFFGTETETIRYDAGSGLCLLGDGAGSFSPISLAKSGLYAPGDVKDLAMIQLANGSTAVLVANNNEYLQLWKISDSSLVQLSILHYY